MLGPWDDQVLENSYEFINGIFTSAATQFRYGAYWGALVLALFSLTACGGCGPSISENPGAQPTPSVGAYEFLGADALSNEWPGMRLHSWGTATSIHFGSTYIGNYPAVGDTVYLLPDQSAPEVLKPGKSGPLFGLFDEGKWLLSVDGERGLHVIDHSDIENPQIVGRLRFSGNPLEMVVTDERVYVVLNDPIANARQVESLTTDITAKAAILAIEIGELGEPVISRVATLEETIIASQSRRVSSESLLYLATATSVSSFELSASTDLTPPIRR